MDRRSNDEERALDLLDRVHVFANHGIEQRLIEAVGRRQHDVKARLVDRERSRARERVEQVERAILFRSLLVFVELALFRRPEQTFLRAAHPRVAGVDDRGAQRTVGVERFELCIELTRDARVVVRIRFGRGAPCVVVICCDVDVDVDCADADACGSGGASMESSSAKLASSIASGGGAARAAGIGAALVGGGIGGGPPNPPGAAAG